MSAGHASAQPDVTARRIAVVGAGISGLAVAWSLAREAQVTLFEADPRFGGHAHTVDIELEGVRGGVDTGFLVYNERTYPELIRLFDTLGVPTAVSDMSFSVQAPALDWEWSGSSLNTVFAQRSNLLSPRFWGMLSDILRFNRLCTQLAEQGVAQMLAVSVGEFLDQHRFSATFRQGYLLPMIGCIWSCPTEQMLAFPMATLIRFCHNHGLIQVSNRPQWRTVQGGSREYVRRMLKDIPDARAHTPVRAVRRGLSQGRMGVFLTTDAGEAFYDHVVLAGHTDQSLSLLTDASAEERRWLGALRYQDNRAVLHTDASLMPRRKLAWAAWNYERSAHTEQEQARVCLHYWLNRLQPLPWQTPVMVSLNPLREPDPASVLREFSYAHPVFDAPAIQAQGRLSEFQGKGHVWYAGAWTRYGFHEDGLMSGLAVVNGLRALWAQDRTPLAESGLPWARAA